MSTFTLSPFRYVVCAFAHTENDIRILTHDLIANMLGVPRECISIAAAHFQHRGLIEYVRGTITMFDRDALEREACECYRVVKDEYDRLLGKYFSANRWISKQK